MENKGPSFANGPGIPAWLRHNPETAMVLETQVTIWTVQA